MTPDRVIQAHATEAALLARIHVLLEQRERDRHSAMRAAWPQARWDRLTELRALVAVARSGRRLARVAVERQDAVTAAMAHADWSESEMAGAWGR